MIDSSLSEILFEAGRALPRAVVAIVASYLIWAMAALLVIALWRARTTYRAFALLAASAALAYAANAVIGLAVVRERPFVSEGFEPLINTAHLAGSFPSDHSAIAWALAFAYAFEKRKNAWLFLSLAFLVSVGRVLAGVHFASDVATGALVGLAAGVLVRYASGNRWVAATF